MSTQDRALPAGELPKAGDQPAAARSTRVLYITGDARESRIVRGAFTHTHPHLDFDFAVELTGARAHLAQAWRYEAIVVGWSVPESCDSKRTWVSSTDAGSRADNERRPISRPAN